MDLLYGPTYHYISPLARSRSEIRGAKSVRRSNSFAYGSGASSYGSGAFTMPQYGYGGGYMSRSLSRSSSSLFGRSLYSSVLTRTPPLHNVGVQRSTPHYTDKYPYVRYSYGSSDTGLGIMEQTESIGSRNYGVRDLGTKRWLEGRLNSYNSGLFTTPNHSTRIERPVTPVRNYVRYMPIEDAVNMYKKRCMTVGTLSKYWLSPTWNSRRDYDSHAATAPARSGGYTSLSRNFNNPTYSRVASRLYTNY
ncbi:unnamed protein product [Thelazia callipaeda]|uniref:Uncharacterized protein n=1 Tax=Thelazia callipaeda TaxID=103827 RepID=A0A0N5D798_THECL|nr:unnamed protein product [Thelazia callipaeda]